jgi:hypothetical protein
MQARERPGRGLGQEKFWAFTGMFPGAVSHLYLGQLRRAIPYIFIFLTTQITAKMDSIIVRRQPNNPK